MSPARLPETVVKPYDRKLSGIGATEDQMDIRGAIAQRIDKKGTKIEDLGGIGGHDSNGG
jgi:hypothetical protein